eukprot:61761_1
MCWLINNDISTCLVDQKKTNEIHGHSFSNNWFVNSKIRIITNDKSYSTTLERSIMSIKSEFYHFYVMKSVNIHYPCTVESWPMGYGFPSNISIKTLNGHIFTNY